MASPSKDASEPEKPCAYQSDGGKCAPLGQRCGERNLERRRDGRDGKPTRSEEALQADGESQIQHEDAETSRDHPAPCGNRSLANEAANLF